MAKNQYKKKIKLIRRKALGKIERDGKGNEIAAQGKIGSKPGKCVCVCVCVSNCRKKYKISWGVMANK